MSWRAEKIFIKNNATGAVTIPIGAYQFSVDAPEGATINYSPTLDLVDGSDEVLNIEPGDAYNSPMFNGRIGKVTITPVSGSIKVIAYY